jgi:hypothetical protein
MRPEDTYACTTADPPSFGGTEAPLLAALDAAHEAGAIIDHKAMRAAIEAYETAIFEGPVLLRLRTPDGMSVTVSGPSDDMLRAVLDVVNGAAFVVRKDAVYPAWEET